MKQKLIELVREEVFSFDLLGVVTWLCRYILQISTNTSAVSVLVTTSRVCSVKINEVTVAHSRFCRLAIVVEHDDDDGDEEREEKKR